MGCSLLISLGGCRFGAEGQRHIDGRGTNVFLVVLDAASAPFFSSYGAGPAATPNIRRLARDSVVFERAYSQTATTAPSVASLLTGVRATTHGMKISTTLPEDLPTVAEMLGRHGYRTFGVIGNPMAGIPRLGFDRGYDECVHTYWIRSTRDNPELDDGPGYRVVFPEDLNEQIFELLPQFEERGTFVYVHYLQPHTPYDPPQEFRKEVEGGAPRSGGLASSSWPELNEALKEANQRRRADPELAEHLTALYRANLKYVDVAIGRMLERLEAKGLYEESLIVLTADHGDAFFGHRLFGHNWTLYDDMTRIPLMIKFPQSDGIGPRRISLLTETVDVLPTVFDYLDLPIPERFEGDSLWPVITGERGEIAGPEVVMTTLHRRVHAIRVGDYKFIYHRDGREELYNLRMDPEERWDLISREQRRAEVLRRKLMSVVDVESGASLPEDNAMFRDEDMKRLLTTLGYVESEMNRGEEGASREK